MRLRNMSMGKGSLALNYPGSNQIVRYLNVLVVLTFLGLCAVVLHFFYKFIGSAPYLATDDAVANISHGLSHLGRLGFQAGPIQAGTNTIRTDGFFNYGPWYFYLGAALSWLLGTSLEVQRSIHLFGLLAIVACAFVAFRRISLAAAGVFGAVILYVFVYAHWPMIRPDIMVSILAAMAITAVSSAILTRRLHWWFVAAFCTTAAVTQHLISGALAPAMLLVWALTPLVWKVSDSRGTIAVRHGSTRRAFVASLLAATLGVVVAGAIYLAAIDFRVAEVVQHLTSYSSDVADTDVHGGYGPTVLKHAAVAWGGGIPSWLRYALIAGFGFAVILLLCMPAMSGSNRCITFALLFPPSVSAIAYQASLGFYGNWHSGYSILSQVTVVWTACAALAVSVHLLRQILRAINWAPEILLSLVVVAGLCLEARLFVQRPSGWLAAEQTWVNIEDYLASVFSPLPTRATAWGTFAFGLESGIRADFLQMGEGVLLAENFKTEQRDAVAPEYLVFGYRELNDISASAIADPAAVSFFTAIPKLLANHRYELIHIASAPPYGSARVYRQGDRTPMPLSVPPSVRVNDGTSRQWNSRLLPPRTVDFKKGKAVSFYLPYKKISFEPPAGSEARGSLVATLAKGIYLIAARIERRPVAGSGILIATSTSRFIGHNSELGHGFVPTPYFPDEKTVYMLVPHEGGPLFISQFDADPQAQFTIVNVRPIERDSSDSHIRPLPPLDAWHVQPHDAAVAAVDADRINMVGDGNPSGYQLVSPAISVPARSVVTLTLPIKVLSGRLGIGILDGDQRWLLAPQAGTSRVTFDTGHHQRITVVVSNVYADTTQGPSRFEATRGNLSTAKTRGAGTYTDRLTQCHRTQKHRNPDLCR